MFNVFGKGFWKWCYFKEWTKPLTIFHEKLYADHCNRIFWAYCTCFPFIWPGGLVITVVTSNQLLLADELTFDWEDGCVWRIATCEVTIVSWRYLHSRIWKAAFVKIWFMFNQFMIMSVCQGLLELFYVCRLVRFVRPLRNFMVCLFMCNCFPTKQVLWMNLLLHLLYIGSTIMPKLVYKRMTS